MIFSLNRSPPPHADPKKLYLCPYRDAIYRANIYLQKKHENKERYLRLLVLTPFVFNQ
jgi:hypothetical protein